MWIFVQNHDGLGIVKKPGQLKVSDIYYIIEIKVDERLELECTCNTLQFCLGFPLRKEVLRMKRGFTPTVHHSNREIVRVSDTMYIGVPKTGHRVNGAGKFVSQTPQMRAFRSVCG